MVIKPRKELENVTPYQPGKPIEEVKREMGLKDVIKLASNESAVSPSPKVLKAVKEAAKDINRYPDGGSFYLKKAISGKFSVPQDNIVLGNGSDELIVLALRAFVTEGEEVIVSSPTFLVYSIAASVVGAKVVTVPAKELRYDLGSILRAVTPRTRMIFIANPDNPTGSYLSKAEISGFVEKVPENVILFIDEAYYEFGPDRGSNDEMVSVQRPDKNIIRTRTFSKAYGLAGLRIGYGFARKDIAAAINKVREPFNINSLAQTAAIAALDDEAYMKMSVDLVNKEKNKLFRAMESMDVRAVPSSTNFILIETFRDSMKIFKFLLERGIIVREMSSWGFKGFVRVTVGTKKENEKFLRIFGDALNAVEKEK
ncbi:MAG: histidinol-phosphate transaminase [Candidatus Omnitrophota bacterium]